VTSATKVATINAIIRFLHMWVSSVAPGHAASKIFIEGRLWRSDVAIIAVVISYDGRCTRVLDAA
jgi:hypothetical protein